MRQLYSEAKKVKSDPSDGQRQALNYKQGHIKLHGLDITIEVPCGGIRKGVSKDGECWERRMKAHYGRIRRSVGADGEPVDVYIGSAPSSKLVFVIDQLKPDTGDLDEHKVMLGYPSASVAIDDYLRHYPKDWKDKGLGQVRGMNIEDFKLWLKSDAPRKGESPKGTLHKQAGPGTSMLAGALNVYRSPVAMFSNALIHDKLKEKKPEAVNDDYSYIIPEGPELDRLLAKYRAGSSAPDPSVVNDYSDDYFEAEELLKKLRAQAALTAPSA